MQLFPFLAGTKNLSFSATVYFFNSLIGRPRRIGIPAGTGGRSRIVLKRYARMDQADLFLVFTGPLDKAGIR